MQSDIGIVIIGRNEAARLDATFKPVISTSYSIIYVDSASTDTSLQIAKNYNLATLYLSDDACLCAARSRNAGFKELHKMVSTLEYVQFVDGDTVLFPEWIEQAYAFLKENPHVAVVEGVLEEKEPRSSFSKRIFQMEWEHQKGEVQATGGNCMIRRKAFSEVEGYNEHLVAGEEPEMCYRMREKGWKIYNLGIPMGVHDSAHESFLPLLKRMMRTGYSFQQLSLLHKGKKERLFYRENLSNWVYGGLLPLLILLFLPWYPWVSGALLMVYPLLFIKIYTHLNNPWSPANKASYALFCIVSKFPGFIGACQYLYKRF